MKSSVNQCKRNLLRLGAVMDRLNKAGAVILDVRAGGNSGSDMQILLAQGLEQLAKENGLKVEECQYDPLAPARRVVLDGVPIEQYVH